MDSTGEAGITVDAGQAASAAGGAGQAELFIDVAVEGEGEGTVTAGDEAEFLALWLREDPELEQHVRVETRERPPGPDQAMGTAEEIAVLLLNTSAEVVALELMRSLYNYLRNRGNRGNRRVTVTVRVTPDISLTLESPNRLSRRQLRQLARQAAEAIRPDVR